MSFFFSNDSFAPESCNLTFDSSAKVECSSVEDFYNIITDPEEVEYPQAAYILLATITTIIFLFGLSGNTLSAYILHRPALRSPFTLLVIFLCFFDNLNIILLQFIFIYPEITIALTNKDRVTVQSILHLINPYTYPLTRICKSKELYT